MPLCKGQLRALLLTGALMAALLPAFPTPTVAQSARAFRTQVPLTQSDLTIIRKIVREDFTGKPNGTTQSWKNPETKNSGTVTLLDHFESQGRDCRRVKYFIAPGANQPASENPTTYVLTNCRLADGTWKIDNQARRDASR